jgi:hypothetical protein
MATISRVLGLIKEIGGGIDNRDFDPPDKFPTAQPYEGYHYADDGNYYEDPQTAIDNASSYVSMGGVTVEANLTIQTEGFILECMSEQTLVDGTDQGAAITVDASDVDITGMRVRTDPSTTNNAVELTGNASNCDINDILVEDAGGSGIVSQAGADEVELREVEVDSCDNRGIDLQGIESRVEACYIFGGADDGIRIQGGGSAIAHSFALGHGNEGLEVEGNRSRCIGNTVDGVADNGILLQGDDCVCNGNVVSNAGGDGVVVQGEDDVIVANRVGGSGGTNINTSGATTPTQTGNNTGALN